MIAVHFDSDKVTSKHMFSFNLVWPDFLNQALPNPFKPLLHLLTSFPAGLSVIASAYIKMKSWGKTNFRLKHIPISNKSLTSHMQTLEPTGLINFPKFFFYTCHILYVRPFRLHLNHLCDPVGEKYYFFANSSAICKVICGAFSILTILWIVKEFRISIFPADQYSMYSHFRIVGN